MRPVGTSKPAAMLQQDVLRRGAGHPPDPGEEGRIRLMHSNKVKYEHHFFSYSTYLKERCVQSFLPRRDPCTRSTVYLVTSFDTETLPFPKHFFAWRQLLFFLLSTTTGVLKSSFSGASENSERKSGHTHCQQID